MEKILTNPPQKKKKKQQQQTNKQFESQNRIENKAVGHSIIPFQMCTPISVVGFAHCLADSLEGFVYFKVNCLSISISIHDKINKEQC